jgi:hypothetical protein
LEYGEFLIQRILGAFAEHQPDIVYAPSWWEIHPDHLALAMATVEAVRRSPRPLRLAMYEVGVPLHPNMLLDITDIVDCKQAAVACFPSQLAQQPYDQHIAALNRFRTYTLPASVTAAEAYRTVSQEELKADPLTMIRPGVYYGQTSRHEDAAPPLVSVIVRSKDGLQLADALNSIALQTYPNIEILVVNAKDGVHSEVAAWHERFPTRLFSPETPASDSRAANIGLDSARGDYLIVIDDNHVFYPDHVAALVLGLRNAVQFHAAYTGVRFDYFSQGEIVRTSEFNQSFQRAQLGGQNYIPMNAVLFDRALLNKGCRFDETLGVLEDWDFLLQLSLHTEFLHLNQVSVFCRNNGDTGVAVSRSADYLLQSTAAVFQKWKSIWSGLQLGEVVWYIDSKREQSERESAALHHRLAELEADLAHRTELSYSLETRNAEQQRRLADFDQLSAELATQLATRDTEIAHGQQKVTTLRLELSEQVTALHNNDAIVADLHQTIAALHNSTSWKMTSPLRRLAAVLRRRLPAVASLW